MATTIRGDDNFDTGVNGRVLGVTTYTNSTRQALSSAASIVMASFVVDKLSSTSKLVISGSISGDTNNSGSMQQGWKFGAGVEVNAQALMYEATNNSKCFPTSAIISGHTITGTQTMVFRFYTGNGVAALPFITYNPNSSDDGRNGQTSSVFTVTEVEA